MEILQSLAPYMLSVLIGYSLINLIFDENNKPSPSICLFLGAGLGIGLSGHMTFLSILIFHQFNRVALIILTALVLGLLVWLQSINVKKNPNIMFSLQGINVKQAACYLAILLLLVPLWKFAQAFHPYGGWDAWQVWNFKSKFLFVAGEHWTNMLNPLLWRTSPHYPLLLPSINVWGWAFLKNPETTTPLLTALIFTFLTAGLLFSSLKALTGSYVSILAPLAFLTLPFAAILSTSQYSDILVGYYFLASCICFILSQETKHPGHGLLTGLFLGLLTFTKPEGQMLCVVTAFIMAFFWGVSYLKSKDPSLLKKLLFFGLGLFLAIIPTAIFQLFFAPDNQTFINGFTSTIQRSDSTRIKVILIYLIAEIFSEKWNGMWVLLFLGLLASQGRALNKKTIIIPLTLGIYGLIVLTYYFLNTYFEISWWLQNTLARLLFAVLPAFLFWVTYSASTNSAEKKTRTPLVQSLKKTIVQS